MAFPSFSNLSLNLDNKKLIIWATVSSRSCFCWLYRAFPSSAANNIINLILVLTIWWCPRVELSLVLLEDGVWSACSLGKSLLAFFLLHFVLQGQTVCYFRYLLTSLHSSPLWWKGHLFWVLVLEGLVGLHGTIQFQLLQHYWLGYRLGLLWYWMVCLENKQRSFYHFWDCSQVLHFRLLLTMRATPFLLRILAHSSRYNGHLN